MSGGDEQRFTDTVRAPMSDEGEVRPPPVAPAPVAAPGFYPDPNNPRAELYWDGDKWTNEDAPSAPDPGFYPDPNDASVERYWDGKKWTESRQPAGSGKRPTDEKEQKATGIIIAGYAFAVLMPIVGFVIGLTQINRNRHGVWVVVVAAVAFAIWVGILSADQNAYR